jgi:hypothetical protein
MKRYTVGRLRYIVKRTSPPNKAVHLDVRVVGEQKLSEVRSDEAGYSCD